MPDLYLYDDAPVLRNKLDIHDEKTLDMIEAEQPRQNMMTFFVEHYGYYMDQELMAASAGYVRDSFVMASLDQFSEYEHLEKILMRRVYGYLMKHRHIDKSVIAHFARAGTLYEDAKYHNCVFIGRDETGKACHAHKRSTNSCGEAFRINVEGGDPRYTFHHLGSDGSLYVFEAPIDLLSFISLYQRGWQEHNYVACCGVSIQPVLKMLERIQQFPVASSGAPPKPPPAKWQRSSLRRQRCVICLARRDN